MVSDLRRDASFVYRLLAPIGTVALHLSPFFDSGAFDSAKVIKTMLDECQVLNAENWFDESESADLRFIAAGHTSGRRCVLSSLGDDYVIAMPVGSWLAGLSFYYLSQRQIDKQPFISRTPGTLLNRWNYSCKSKNSPTDVRATGETEEYCAGLGRSRY